MPRTRRTSRARFVPEPPIYTFRVRILGGFYAPPDARLIWREVEVAANQTMDALGWAIPQAFEFDLDHMWSFYLSGKAWDTDTEYAVSPDEDIFTGKTAKDANTTLIRDVPYPGKTGKKEFLFVYDFGDEWHFGVKLLRQNPTIEAKARFPRLVAAQGDSPEEYPYSAFMEDEDENEDEEGEPLVIFFTDDAPAPEPPK
jgi:hypothetical protein